MSNYKVIGEDDGLEIIGAEGVLDRLHHYSSEVLKRDESAPARCRYPDYIDRLCGHIGARENIQTPRVYTGLVAIGYGKKYDSFKNGDTLMYDVAKNIGIMRASTDEEDVFISSMVDNTISFSGKGQSFRYMLNFIAEVSDYAERSNISAPDMYFYYALVGLCEVGSLDDYVHIRAFTWYRKAMYELDKANSGFETVISFIGRFL